MRRIATALVAAVAVLLTPIALPSAWGDARDQAREHFARGKELYGKGKYQTAIREFSAADKLAPSPLLQFNIALCYDKLGDRPEALRRYKLYLEKAPDAPNRTAVEQKIARLEEELHRQAADAAQAAGLESKPPAAPATPTASPAKSPVATTAPAPVVPTGDPELDRVAAIDVGAISAQRGAQPPVPGPGAGVPQATDLAEKSQPPPPAPNGATPPPPSKPETPQSKPIYKQWWFWVIIGVSALIVADIAISAADHKSSNTRSTALPETRDTIPSASGPALLRF
jgi:tetratricopeptide (TPR) repeat protein